LTESEDGKAEGYRFSQGWRRHWHEVAFSQILLPTRGSDTDKGGKTRKKPQNKAGRLTESGAETMIKPASNDSG
jgi:hypothetical protein